MTKAKNLPEVTTSQLHQATLILSNLVLRTEHAHMKGPVEMIIGGLIFPAIKEIDKVGILEADTTYKTLLEKYSKEKIKDFFNPKPIVKIVEKEVPGEGGERPVFRRLKEKVNKVSRIQRPLNSLDRDTLINWWNKNQRLVPDDDPICVTLTDQINLEQGGNEPLSSMQIAGYFSYLCRMGLRTEGDRAERFMQAKRRGDLSLLPVYDPVLLHDIVTNWEKERADEAARVKDHEELRRRREVGDTHPVKASV